MSNLNPRVYSKIVNLSENPNFTSDLMASGYSKMQIDIDFFSDADAETPIAATGSITFQAQTTQDSGNISISQGTVDSADRDYDRPFSDGRIVRVTADLSAISTASYARIDIWRA